MSFRLESRTFFSDRPALLDDEYFDTKNPHHLQRIQNDWEKIQKKRGKALNGRNLFHILALIADGTVDFTNPKHLKTICLFVERYADKFKILTNGDIIFNEATIPDEHFEGDYSKEKKAQTIAAFSKLKKLLEPEYSGEFLTHCPKAARKLPPNTLHKLIKDHLLTQDWGKTVEFIALSPGYAEILDAEDIEAMFAATRGETTKFTQLLNYLLAHEETIQVLINSKLFESASDTAYSATEQHGEAISAIRNFFYVQVPFQLQEKYFSTTPELVRQLYAKRLEEFSTLIRVMHTPQKFLVKQDWLRPQAKPSHFLVTMLPTIHEKLTAKNSKKFLLNGSKKRGNRFIDALYANADQVQPILDKPEVYRHVLLTTLKTSLEVGDVANISSDRLKQWIKNSNYDPIVCRFIATSDGLRKRFMPVTQPNHTQPYLKAAYDFQRAVNRDGIKTALRTLIVTPSQPDPALCALIASRNDYWQQLLALAIPKKKFWLSKSIQQKEVSDAQDKLGRKSLFFKALLAGMSFAEFLVSTKASAEDKDEYTRLSVTQDQQQTNVYQLEEQLCARPHTASNSQPILPKPRPGSNAAKKLAAVQKFHLLCTSNGSTDPRTTVPKLTVVEEVVTPAQEAQHDAPVNFMAQAHTPKKDNTHRAVLSLDETTVANTIATAPLSPRCA